MNGRNDDQKPVESKNKTGAGIKADAHNKNWRSIGARKKMTRKKVQVSMATRGQKAALVAPTFEDFFEAMETNSENRWIKMRN